jgi:S1-C subfamily serine protease
MRGVALSLALTLALAASGCGFEAAAPPAEPPTTTVPALTPVSPLVAQATEETVPTIARDSTHRAAEQLTVRVRNVNCTGITLGSGFAIAPNVLVTNRHVLAGADKLTIDTWDGETIGVRTAKVGALEDLGLAVVDRRLPTLARFGPAARAGDSVTVVGYPLGGALTFSNGVVVDRVDGSAFGVHGDVLRLTARVEHGNSGGPVLDAQGQVVGVVFAIQLATGFGLAIPNETLLQLVRTGGFEPLPPCGSG